MVANAMAPLLGGLEQLVDLGRREKVFATFVPIGSFK
jgi:hypothetical protein